MYFLSLQLKVIVFRIMNNMVKTYKIWTSRLPAPPKKISVLEPIELICITLADDQYILSQNQSHQMSTYQRY